MRSIQQKRLAYDVKGTFSAHALFSLSTTRQGRNLTMSMLEQSSAYVYAISEMLLQSHQGIIRIFPAVPECLGDCAFKNLRTEGAFLISGRMRKRKTMDVTLKSLCGNKCVVKIYDIPDSDTIALSNEKNKKIVANRVAPNTWEFVTKRDEQYYWTSGIRKRDIELRPFNVSGVKEYKDRQGNIVYYGKKGHIYEE